MNSETKEIVIREKLLEKLPGYRMYNFKLFWILTSVIARLLQKQLNQVLFLLYNIISCTAGCQVTDAVCDSQRLFLVKWMFSYQDEASYISFKVMGLFRP